MKLVSFQNGARIALLAMLATIAPEHIHAAKVKVVITHGEAEVVMRERSGNSSRIIKQKAARPNDPRGVELKNRSGTVGNSGRGYVDFFGSYDQPDFGFHCQAKGENTQDSSAPAGHESDNITTFTTVKLSETLALDGFRIGALTFGEASYIIDFGLDGKVEKSGDTTVASGRAQFQFKNSNGAAVTFSSEDASPVFDGVKRPKQVAGTLFSLDQPFTFSVELLAVACIAKHKQCSINADILSTVRITGVTLQSAGGLRFEAPEIASASGIDYGPLLNVPQPSGSGADEFAFASDVLGAGEADGTLLVRVNREHAGAGAASVTVRNAAPPPAGADFEPFSTTLDFADGETQKFVLVKLIDDDVQQPIAGAQPFSLRKFEIELVNATTAAISTTRNKVSVTLDDDEISWSAPDPGPATLVARINPGGASGQTGLLTFSIDANLNCTFRGVLRGGKFSGKGTSGELDFIGGGKLVNVPGIGAVKFIFLRYNSEDGVPLIRGTATLPDNTVLPIRGVQLHAQLDQKPATSKRGGYTMLLDPAAGAPADAPLGSGFARVKVLPTGKVIIIGKLADGTPLSAGGAFNVLRQLPLLVSLKTKGEISGVLHFRSIPGTSDIDGELRWLRPPAIKPGLFSAGFTTALAASGSRYVPPTAGAYVLPGLAATTEKAVFHAGSPDLAAALDREITIGVAPKNTVAPPLPNNDKLGLKLAGKTGLWSGSFLEAGKPVKFQGALLQPGNRGAGYFPGATQSGRATLAPGTLPP